MQIAFQMINFQRRQWGKCGKGKGGGAGLQHPQEAVPEWMAENRAKEAAWWREEEAQRAIRQVLVGCLVTHLSARLVR